MLADLAYLGLSTDFAPAYITLPHRKPRRSKAQPHTCLTTEHQLDNSQPAKVRVKIEHAIGGSKRLGVITQMFRNKSLFFNDLAIALAAGIWNFHLKDHGFI